MKLIQTLKKMALLDMSALRYKYKDRTDVFREDSLPIKEPFSLFKNWIEEAINDTMIVEPNGMCISTVNKDGQPSSRFVLMKGYSKEGITFFTNYNSRKANELAINPKIAATFYWYPLKKQIRIEGTVSKVSKEESEKYFHERPRDSQIGALASKQSSVIPNREHLDKIETDIRSNLGPDEPVPMPDWGGYLIKPHLFEFWQGQSNRLHDRIQFRRYPGVEKNIDDVLTKRGDEGWVYERLAP